jgi:segregation and condensation protein B
MSTPDSDDDSFPVPIFEADRGQPGSAPANRTSSEPHHPPADPSTADPAPAGVAGPGDSGTAEPSPPLAAGPGGSVVEASAATEGGEWGAGDPVAAGEAGVGAGTTPDGESGERLEAEGAIAADGPGLGSADAWPSDEALEAVELDDSGWTRRSLEAILLVADEPVPAATLAELVGARLTEVEAQLIELAGEYAGDGRGFVLRAVAGGWRLYTHPATREVVEAYLRAGQQSRLTRAALETLAVVAYRQPVTRHQVAAVRGVNVDGVFRTLATRGLIHEVGHEEGPGQAALYATTPAFLEQLGLNGLDQLPPIKDYLPEGVDLMELLEQM